LDLESQWLVTASALLDLVAPNWLEALLARCRAGGARLLFALTYDGIASFSPKLGEDALVNDLINRHQTRDKGFGPALGPRAASDAPGRLRQYGYDVAEAPSPWRIGLTQRALQSALIEGWAEAAIEVDPDTIDLVRGWRRRRQDYIAAGKSRLYVGHRDLLAWPVADENE
jgi:hypothetical protein